MILLILLYSIFHIRSPIITIFFYLKHYIINKQLFIQHLKTKSPHLVQIKHITIKMNISPVRIRTYFNLFCYQTYHLLILFSGTT